MQYQLLCNTNYYAIPCSPNEATQRGNPARQPSEATQPMNPKVKYLLMIALN